MGNFQGGGNRGGGFRGHGGGGRPSFPKKSWGDDRPRDMHQATCSECGKPCEVPFKPTGEKPVYCNACFSSKRAEGGDSRGPRKDFGDRGDRKPFGGRPSYQSTPRPTTPPSGNDDLKRQMSEISGKLDRLINSMEKLVGPSKVVVVSSAPAKVAPVVKAIPVVVPAKKVEDKKAPVKAEAKKKPASKPKKKK
ncbi:MAG: CxxC-x17-CxxC domain-containing protein [Candidatus Doudnabacteria bacterium]|jgi:CxxC-x17-CxxC domain-containing protein